MENTQHPGAGELSADTDLAAPHRAQILFCSAAAKGNGRGATLSIIILVQCEAAPRRSRTVGVPVVLAVAPGQRGPHGREQVEDGPGVDHVVVDGDHGDGRAARVPHTCATSEQTTLGSRGFRIEVSSPQTNLRMSRSNSLPPFAACYKSASNKRARGRYACDVVELCSDNSTYSTRTATVPLKMGDMAQTETGPTDENCPSANSRKKMGIPQHTSINTYGTKNAPAEQQRIHRVVRAVRVVTGDGRIPCFLLSAWVRLQIVL